MNKNTPTSSFSISKMYCSVFGHKYQLSKKVTHHIKEYTCCHCGKQMTTNSKGKLEAMTPKLKEINDVLAFVHAKKLAKINEGQPYQVAS